MPRQTLSLDASAVDPIGALKRVGGVRHNTHMRRIAIAAALLGAGAVAAVAAPKVLHTFGDALVRALHADPGWVVAAIALELASFTAYIALFWHVAGNRSPRIGLRASGEIALASTAATRLLPTAGAGGAALTFWSLRRAGQDNRAATSTLLSFLVVLYSVFLAAIAVSGGLIALGLAAGDGPLALSAIPAGAATLAIAASLALGIRRPRTPARAGRLHAAADVFGAGVRDAIGHVRSGDPRLLGALAWWTFDASVLWAMLHAFGAPPPLAVVVLAYFVGQVGNTLPIPGAVSGGIVGVLVAFAVPTDLALVSVLAYRAIAIWLPAPIGLVALGSLRRTIARWGEEDAAPAAAPAPTPAAVARTPRPCVERELLAA